MPQQPTAEQYQTAFERVTMWPDMAGDTYARLVGAVVDTGGFNMELPPTALAVLRVFLGAEYAEHLGKGAASPRRCTYCDGAGQVEFCDDVCGCGPVDCGTCGATGVLS